MQVKPTQNITLSVECNGNAYQLIVPGNAPLGEMYDVLHTMLQHVTQSASKATEASKRPEPNAEAS